MRTRTMTFAAVLLATTASAAHAQLPGGDLLGNVLGGNGNGLGGVLAGGDPAALLGGGANLPMDTVGDLIKLSPVSLGDLTGALGSLNGLLTTLDNGPGELGMLPGLEGLMDGVGDLPVPAGALGDLIELSPLPLGNLTGALGSLDGVLVPLQGNGDFGALPGLPGL